MKPITLDDLGQLAPTLARAVSNVGTYHDHLTVMSELNMLLRRAVAQPKTAPLPRGPKIEQVRVGSLVNYWDPKKGANQTAHVLEVHDGRIKIRVNRGATPDYDVDRVPYSAKPKVGHWSYR